MKKLPVLLGTVVTLALSGAFATSALAQNERASSGAAKEPITIQGVVAEIVAEGEVIYDYQHDKAVAAEAAFMTVVGSPKKSETGGERATKATTGGAAGKTDGKHDNIYIIWLTPKTKVCKAMVDTGGVKRASTTASERSEKKECSLDELEVGEQVEIQFIPRAEKNESQVGHQTDKMRQTHGRDRTYVGYASEVTILEPKDQGSSGRSDK